MNRLTTLLLKQNKTLSLWKSPRREYWVASAMNDQGDACEQGEGSSPEEAKLDLIAQLR
jgi:hypothetical protein